jgi:hypothetical protein
MSDDARPRPLDIAFGLYCAAAAASALLGLALLLQLPASLEQARGEATSRHLAAGSYDGTVIGIAVALVAIALAFAGVLLLAAFKVRAGRPWARPVLVALTVLSVAPFNAAALLVTAVLVVAGVLVFRPAVTTWLRAQRDARALGR